MTREFCLPDLGEGIREGQVMELRVAPGDRVQEDQPLLVVETDKAAVEIPSPHTGVIEAIAVEEGQVIQVGEVMIVFSGLEESPAAPASPATPTVKNSSTEPINHSSPAATVARRKPASPAVRKRARQLGIDIETITGSGPAGRIVMADLEQPPVSPPPDSSDSHPTAIVAAKPQSTLSPSPVVALPPVVITEIAGTEGEDQYGRIVRQPVSQARKAIARVMCESMRSIPHVTDCEDADITDLEAFRRGYVSPADPGKAIPTLPFVIRAVARALQAFPLFNASYDEERAEIIFKRYCHIAIGVQTDRGLIAPIIRDADRLTVPQLAEQLAVITENARTARFSVEDTRGGTYTISNAGAMGGSRYSTPIITPPQVAVLALGKARWMPWVVGGEIKSRFILPLSHSMDHRIIDGAGEIAFIRQIIGDLEHPARLLL